MNWRKLKYLSPSRRRQEETDMQEELESLAQIAGRRELGNLTIAAENARAAWHWTPFDGVLADLRYAVRTLRRTPGFVAVAVVSLGLGIGANCAIFSFADALLFRPLPVPHPGEVVSISNSTLANPIEGLSYPDYRDIREKSRSFSGLVAYRSIQLGVGANTAAPPQMRLATMVSDNFFSALEIAPSLGRSLLPDEGLISGRDPVAILGHDFWIAQYGADPFVVGRNIRLNGVQFTIIGVAPESFTGMDLVFRPALFVPISTAALLTGNGTNLLEDRALREFTVKGRLSDGASLPSAQAELAGIGQALAAAFPKTNQDRHVAVHTEFDARSLKAPQSLGLVWMLRVLAGLVLLIACANVANLMLARARARRREIAVRVAIGAGRLRLARQLMTENLVLALLGGLAGLGFAFGGMRFLETLQLSSDIPIVLGLEIDQRLLTFSLFVALMSCLLFGLAPALQSARTELVSELKSAAGTLAARHRIIGRNSLVVSQIALAMVLLIIAGAYIDGSRRLLKLNPGFRTDHVISMDLDPSVLRYPPDRTRDFYRTLLDRVRALPGVKSTAMAEALPYSTNPAQIAVAPEGYQFPNGKDVGVVFGGAYDESYFSTMKIDILRGRAFDLDDRAGSRLVAIVNEEFAKSYWPGQNALGKQIRLNRPGGPALEVVGVARTGRYLFPAESPRPYVYLAYEQNPRSRMTVIAETYGDPAGLAADLRNTVRGLDADLPILNLRTVAAHEARTVKNWLIFVEMFTSMGMVGLILAMVGLYGLVTYSVSRRTSEIGLRIAIGASRTDVLRLVLRQGLILSAVGVTMGGLLAYVAAPTLVKGVPGSVRLDLMTCLVVPAGLFIVSAAACYMPARRAATLDPIRALRCE